MIPDIKRLKSLAATTDTHSTNWDGSKITYTENNPLTQGKTTLVALTRKEYHSNIAPAKTYDGTLVHKLNLPTILEKMAAHSLYLLPNAEFTNRKF